MREDSCQKAMENGYKIMCKVFPYYVKSRNKNVASRMPCFDVKHASESEEGSDIFKKTFVNLREKGVGSITLKSEDVIKMGREVYRVSIISDKLCPNLRWMCDIREQEGTVQGVCRICLSG